MKLNKTIALTFLILSILFLSSVSSLQKSDQVRQDQEEKRIVVGNWGSSYVGNIFNYFTWNATYILCSVFGWLLLILTADRGQTYISCMIGFQGAFYMG